MLTVMQQFAASRRTTNPYLIQLFDAVSGPVRGVNFSWRQALLGRFDILHLHWPEVVCRSPSRPKTWLRRFVFLLVILRIRWSRRALVRTLHNAAPHEAGGRIERWLLELCDRTTTVWIVLGGHTPVPVPNATVALIPHGDYRTWFAEFPRPEPEPGRLVYFGLIRPYKGVDHLLSAFAGTTDPRLRLRIAGQPAGSFLEPEIAAACRTDHRVSADLSYIDDAQLADEVGRAELVVLPYRDLQNSGSLLLALSLDRPVLVPDNAVTRQLAAEVGPGWVHTFTGRLTSEDLQDALQSIYRIPGRQRPNLDGRRWDVVGRAHVDAYELAARLTGGRRFLGQRSRASVDTA